MTRDEILAMEPGPELDALVAVKVMKWGNVVGGVYEFDPNERDVEEWTPSTYVADAWEVVQQLNGKFAFEVGRAGDYLEPDRKWMARFGMTGYVESENTASEAICKAALLAVME